MSIELEPSKSYPGRTDLIHKHRDESNMSTRLALTPEDIAALVQALAAAGHIKPEVKVEEDEELIVYGYCVVDRDGDFISPFEKQQDAIDYAAGQNKDCQDAGIDWDYRVAAIVDQGGL